MKSKKCTNCGFINWRDAEACSRCLEDLPSPQELAHREKKRQELAAQQPRPGLLQGRTRIVLFVVCGILIAASLVRAGYWLIKYSGVLFG